MAEIPLGPNYDEMLNPGLLDRDLRARALAALQRDELDPVNLTCSATNAGSRAAASDTETECGALVDFRRGVDVALMPLHQAFNNGQARANALEFVNAVHPREQLE